jgi:peroxiredoxin
MKISPFIFAAAVSVALSIGVSFAESGTEVKTLDGRTTTLPEHFDQGKWTLVMVWSTYCRICRTEYPGMSDFHDRHKDTDAKVLGISVDGYDQIEYVREYVKNSPMTFDSLIGEPITIASIYKAATEEPFTGTPTYLMFNPKGELVAHNPGQLRVEAIETYIRENAE